MFFARLNVTIIGMQLTDHYKQLLGLTTDWAVESVKLNLRHRRVDIYVEHIGGKLSCVKCNKECSLYDHAPERQWRHLDTMQFITMIHARIPRSKCEEHGVLNTQVPWSGPHSRFTLLFEAFAISVLLSSRSINDARGILNLGWEQAHTIMKRAVERGLKQRDAEEIAWIGLDEKSFRKGQNYISVMSDIDGKRVLDVVEGRSADAANELIDKALNPFQQDMVCGVAMDMSAPYAKAINEKLINADIVHDKFHVVAHLSDAVDKVRKSEHAKLLKNGDKRLSKTKYLWLKNMEHLSSEALRQFEDLRKQSLNVSKAWHIKNMFEGFWDRRNKSFAESYFDYWFKEAKALRLKPITKVADMLKKHLPNILTYYDSFITNAVSEGFNSKIQSIKANARGFRNFENYRTSILFFCGKLNLYPLKT